jgi:hypothetical protein
MADSASTAITLTNIQLVLAALTALGIGAIVSAIITAITTGRREFKSWLRAQQVEANRNFHRSALAIQTYAITGPPREAVTTFDDKAIADAANGLFEHLVEFGLKFQDLTEVANSKTHKVALSVLDTLPLLAWQAIPLPGVINAASLRQRAAASKAMTELTADLTLAMRKDIRVTPWFTRWKEHLEINWVRKKSAYHQQIVSPIDRWGWHAAGDILRDWEVRSVNGETIPETYEGYRVREINLSTATYEGQTLALAVKPAFEPWLFGVVAGLPPNFEYELVADAIRVITGNFTGYKLKSEPHVHQDPKGVRTYAWGREAD